MDTQNLQVRLRLARTQAEEGNVGQAEATMSQILHTLAMNDSISNIERFRVMNLYYEAAQACATKMRSNCIEAIRFIELHNQPNNGQQ